MFLDSHCTVFTFCSWLDLLGVVYSVLDFNSKNLQITSKLLTRGYKYQASKNNWNFDGFRSYSELLSKGFGEISFQKDASEGICHPVSSVT